MEDLGLSHARAYSMTIKQAFRRGQTEMGLPRPLVVTMDSMDDMWYIIKAANRDEMGGRVQRDFPPDVTRCRCRLERLRYSLSKGGITDLTIDTPAVLKHKGKVVRDYYPSYNGSDTTLTEMRFDNDIRFRPPVSRGPRARDGGD